MVLRSTLFVLGSLFVSASLCAQPTWKRVYGGFDVDIAYDAVATNDGGVVVVGSTGSFGQGSSDVYLFKVDENGIRQWSTTLGSSALETASALVEMDDGGFLIVGATNATPSGDYDGLVMRTDADGQLVWQRSYGGGDWDFLYGVDRTTDGGALLAGLTYSWNAVGDAWLLRIDALGDTLWTTRHGGPGYADARSVKVTPDGGGVLAGVTTDGDGDKDALVIKFDSNSAVDWSEAYGGDSLDLARDIILTNDGGYSVVGISESFGSVTEHYHFKLDVTGALEWERNWGQVADQEGFQHIQLDNDEYASIGFVTQGGAGGKDMFLLKSNWQGYFILGQTQGGTEDEIGYSLLRMDGGYLMCGITESYGAGMWDVFLVRTNEVGFTDSDEVITSFDPLSINDPTSATTTPALYPNPSDGTFNLANDLDVTDLRFLDAAGRLVFEPMLPSGTTTIQTGLPSGSYFVEALLRDGSLRHARVLIVRP